MNQKPVILILVPWFAPGFKAGGPIRSCVNIAFALRSTYRVHILCGDRDLGDMQSYEGITVDQWIQYEDGINIHYTSPAKSGYKSISQILTNLSPDIVYLNSLYSLPFTIYPILAKKFKGLKGKWILAPRGAFNPGAIQYKSLKKNTYITALKLLGLLKGVGFHSTNEAETAFIYQYLGQKTEVKTVLNLPSMRQNKISPVPDIQAGLRCVCIARINPIKGIHYMLNAMSTMAKPIILDIYGPMENPDYWEVCKKIINDFPPHVQAHYKGSLQPEEVDACLKKYHLFCMPTEGENFGHSIFEAFLAGRPVLISDQTPWRELSAKQIGWDVPLKEPVRMQHALRQAADMDREELQKWADQSWTYAHNYINNPNLIQSYVELFS